MYRRKLLSSIYYLSRVYYLISVSFAAIANLTRCQKCGDDFVISHEPFNFSHTDKWPRWIRRFERFWQASELVEKSEENQVNTLIYTMGDVADDIFQAFMLQDKDRKKYKWFKNRRRPNEVEAYIQLIVKHLHATDNCLIQIRRSQEQDMVFKNLRSQCLRGIKRGTPC